MTGFRCVPIASTVRERFLATGLDERGNVVRHMVSAGDGAPCRHCLKDAGAGEPMLLGSYNLLGPAGIYWTPSPIFLHAEACARYEGADEVPEIVSVRQVSIRSYDADDMCLYDLGQVVDGRAARPAIVRAMDDPRTKFVNIHTVKPGCLLCRVERA